MTFDLSNHYLKIQESIGTPIPKVEVHLGVHLGVCGLIPSHSLAIPGVWVRLLSCTLDSHLSMPLLWSQAQGQGHDIYSSWIQTWFLLYACKNYLWTRKLICRLVAYLKQSITFGCNNLVTRVFAFLLQCPTITINIQAILIVLCLLIRKCI
jgi:hypothetical protein